MPIRPENRARYPADWKAISERIRFVRAGGRCECEGECGRGTHDGRCPNVHGQPAYGTGSKVILTTAHLEHTPERCEDDDLKAMCQGCHLHYDKQHHAETRYRTQREGRAGSDLFSPRPKEGSTMQEETQASTADTTAADPVAPPPTAIAPDPTIGRVVWFFPSVNEKEHPSYGGQPHSAQIAHVHSAGCVNLGVFDGNGNAYARTSVSLYHPDAVPDWARNAGHYATWIPYQVR